MLESCACLRSCGLVRTVSTFTATNRTNHRISMLTGMISPPSFGSIQCNLQEISDFAHTNSAAIQSIVVENGLRFLEAWNEFFGDNSR